MSGLVGAGLLLLVLAAAYVRIAVVLEVLRSAIGAGVPPRSVMALLALTLAAFVMLPVVETALPAGAALPSGEGEALLAVATAAREPLREFLDRRTPAAERQSLLELARRLRPLERRDAVDGKDLSVLAPAFVLAELKAAFSIGFLLFLPFLVLELLVAVVLTTLGMHALDPRAVALPFKLLLFVAADGWHLIGRGLILGYT